MKKLLFALLLLPGILWAQGQGFLIKGNVTDLGSGQAKIQSTQEDHQVIAAGDMKDGAFTIQGTVPEPGLYFLVLGNEQPHYIFLENAPITVSGSKKDIKNIKIEGSS